MPGRRPKLTMPDVRRADRWHSMGLRLTVIARLLKVDKNTAKDALLRRRGYAEVARG